MAEANAGDGDTGDGFLSELMGLIGLLPEITKRCPNGFQDHFERRSGEFFDALFFGGILFLSGFENLVADKNEISAEEFLAASEITVLDILVEVAEEIRRASVGTEVFLFDGDFALIQFFLKSGNGFQSFFAFGLVDVVVEAEKGDGIVDVALKRFLLGDLGQIAQQGEAETK